MDSIGSENTSAQSSNDETPDSGKAIEQITEELKAEQSMPFAIMGGTLAAFACAIIWALVTVFTGYQYGLMAIGVGLFVGMVVRYFGRGTTKSFGVVGATLSFVGCVGGNFLSIIGFIAKNNSMSTFQALFQVDFSYVFSALPSSLGPMDFLFYALAIYEGYRFSYIAIDKTKGTITNFFGPLMNPSFVRFRFPLLIVGGVLVLGGVYGLQYLASGPVTNTYESGKTSAKGTLKFGKYHGPWTFYYENGRISSTLNYKDGELDSAASWWNEKGILVKEGAFWQGLETGEWKYFDSNGTLFGRGHFEYGRQVGFWEYWHSYKGYGRKIGAWEQWNSNMAKSAEYHFKLGKLDSNYSAWHTNGKMSEQGSYSKDEKCGTWKSWDSTGALQTEFIYVGDTQFVVTFTDKKKQYTVKSGMGEYVSRYPNDSIEEKGRVENSQRTGIWCAYHKNGRLASKTRWKDNKNYVLEQWDNKGEQQVKDGNGIWIVRADTDTILLKGVYKEGLADGDWNYFSAETGKLLRTITYVNGKLEGHYRTFFESGGPESMGSFRNNLREGSVIWYHENGKISSKSHFTAGKKQGKQVFYNYHGQKIREEEYKDGDMIGEKNFI